jgi:hypothetical protein
MVALSKKGKRSPIAVKKETSLSPTNVFFKFSTLYFYINYLWKFLNSRTHAPYTYQGPLVGKHCTNRLPDQLIFFFNLHTGRWNQGPLDTAAT